MSDHEPIAIQPWVLAESQRLASTWPTHRDIVSSYLSHQPEAGQVPHMRERLEREALGVRLPPRRPRLLPIAASAMRTALATVPVTIVALALTPARIFESRWTGDGWGLPASISLVFALVISIALAAVCLQVSADWSRMRHEEESDMSFTSFQISQFFQRANEYLHFRKP